MVVPIMAKVFSLFLLIGLLGTSRSEVSPTETYPRSATLQTDNFKLYWKYSDADITFEIHGKTTGWVGLGTSENGNMVEADICVGWVENGVAKITDRYGAATNAFPPMDTQQDIEILEGKECDGWTIIKFRRQLARCETDHDREITANTERVIWAYGTSDPDGSDIVAGDQHSSTNRGVMSIYLLDSVEVPTSLPTNYETVEMLATNFQVPAMHTYYNCKIFKMPELTTKNHILGYEPVITAGNEANVHHILLYKCADNLVDASELEADGQCYSGAMDHFETCSTVLIAWAIGGSSHFFNNSGLSIGTAGDPVHVMLEIHYDNPTLSSAIVDNSGLRLIYSTQLKDNDLGILEVGNFVNGIFHFIPPAQEFITQGICGKECLSTAMTQASTTKITVVGVMLHSHLAGKALTMRHVRNGVEQPFLGVDGSYDFNFQAVRYLNPTIEVLSGDDLMLECDYNTAERTGMTEAGLSTNDEMCLAYLLYYPRIDLAKCQSNVVNSISYGLVGITNFVVTNAGLSGVSVTEPAGMAGQTVKAVMDSVNWDAARIASFQAAMVDSSATHLQLCQLQSSRTEDALTPLTISSPYTPNSATCVSSSTALEQSRSVGTCSEASSKAPAIQSAKFFIAVFIFMAVKLL